MGGIVWTALLAALFLLGCTPLEGMLCNLTLGSWQADNTKPLYTGSNCPFLRTNFNCQGNSRPNLNFQKQSWRPSGCSLDSVSAAKMAQTFQNKKVLIVGDSLATNFGDSFSCIVNSGSVKLKAWKQTISGVTLRGQEYPGKNFFIIKTFSRFMVENLPPTPGSSANNVNLAAVDPGWGKLANLVDVIVFQATSWWFTGSKVWYSNSKQLQGLTNQQAYEMGLATISQYLRTINFKGSAVLLSASPTLYNLPTGVAAKGSFCETNTILNSNQVGQIGKEFLGLLALQKKAAKTPLKLLDVTTASLYRPDAKVQNWFIKGGKLGPGAKDDCTHWCAGGVPDMWVEALYNFALGRIAL